MFRVRAISTGVAGAPFYYNFYFGIVAPTNADFDAAINDVWNFFESAKTILQSVCLTTVSGSVDVIDEATGLITSTASRVDKTSIGSVAGAAAPAGLSLLGKWATGVRVGGRQVQGHTFLSGLAASAIDIDGTPTAAANGAMANAMTNLSIAGHPQHVIYSKTHHAAYSVASRTNPDRFTYLRSRRV